VNLGLEGKKALVSGGTHGIGLATALELATQGAQVAVFSSNPDRVSAAVALLRDISPGHMGSVADALSPASYGAVTAALENTWGGVDILINNVGGGGRWGEEDILQTAPRVWTEVYDKNMTIAINLTKDLLPYMLRQKWGRVITVTSIYGVEAGGRPWFNIAKTAQTVLMKNLSKITEYSSAGITFNSVAPGPILIPGTGWDTRQKDNHPEAYADYISAHIPRGKLGTPEEVADIITFLASERSGLINGAAIVCDGGQTASF
jgi:3-oxoacyl-[acyl-carrier protein] reductase|tara:strand:- start:5135 stop:5920 length:786 start_codon:yes stop_codon:yes gene_type:complete